MVLQRKVAAAAWRVHRLLRPSMPALPHMAAWRNLRLCIPTACFAVSCVRKRAAPYAAGV